MTDDLVPLRRGGYVARATGTDPKYRLGVEFVKARSTTRKGRKVYGALVTLPGLYEIREGAAGTIDRAAALEVIAAAVAGDLTPEQAWTAMQPRDKAWSKYHGDGKWTPIPDLRELARRIPDDVLAQIVDTGTNRLGFLDFCCVCSAPVDAITAEGWPACDTHTPTLTAPKEGYTGPDDDLTPF